MGAVAQHRTGSATRAPFRRHPRGWRTVVLLLLTVLPALVGLSACATGTTVVAFVEHTWVPNTGFPYYGRVTPAPTGTRVAVQRLVGSTWTDIGSAATDANGNYRVALPSPGPWTYSQRVVARDAGGQQLGVSGTSIYASHLPVDVVSPAIASWLSGRSGSTSVAVYDARTGRTAYYGTNKTYVSASIAKVSILGAVLHRAAAANRSLTSDEKAHAYPMITASSNDDATWLWNSLGGASAVAAWQRSVGMIATTQDPAHWGLTTTTAADQARAVEAIIWGNPTLRPADQTYARSLMRSVTSSQHWGVSAGAPAGATVELKNGWLPHDGAYRVNSIGHVQDATHDYVITVLTSTPGTGTSSFTYGIATIEGVTRLLWGQSAARSMTAAMQVAPDTSAAGR